MPYLIDTDIAIDHLGDDLAAVHLLRQLGSQGIYMSMITYMEVFHGVIRGENSEVARAKFETFVSTVPTLPFSVAVAQRCALLREELLKQGKRIRPRALDLITAATALHHELTLVTRNRADYNDIPGLLLL